MNNAFLVGALAHILVWKKGKKRQEQKIKTVDQTKIKQEDALRKINTCSSRRRIFSSCKFWGHLFHDLDK